MDFLIVFVPWLWILYHFTVGKSTKWIYVHFKSRKFSHSTISECLNDDHFVTRPKIKTWKAVAISKPSFWITNFTQLPQLSQIKSILFLYLNNAPKTNDCNPSRRNYARKSFSTSQNSELFDSRSFANHTDTSREYSSLFFHDRTNLNDTNYG